MPGKMSPTGSYRNGLEYGSAELVTGVETTDRLITTVGVVFAASYLLKVFVRKLSSLCYHVWQADVDLAGGLLNDFNRDVRQEGCC